MGYKGTVKGKVIELDEPLPFPDGTRVEVTVQPEVQPEKKLPKGSPKLIVQLLAGTLTPEEADAILKAAMECRRIDWEMWEEGEKP